MTERDIRQKIITLCRQMNASGLNQGTSGNIRARLGSTMLITPSGVPYDDLVPEQIPSMDLEHDRYEWQGPLPPSSEWHFHHAILKAKPDCGSVVHTHANFSTVLSIGRSAIPACHYMVGAFGGTDVRCAQYATFGTPQLAEHILDAMDGRLACLIANHGMVTAGRNLDHAMWLAVELEALAKQYYFARLGGDVVILPDEEMIEILRKFKHYGPTQRISATET